MPSTPIPTARQPLVATVYWWLYSGWGAPFPALTSIAVCLQAVSCFALVYYAARTLYGATGGLIAAGALAGSSLFVYGVVIGQETGFTALSYAGQLAFAIAATRRPQAGSVILAGLFAGIGGARARYGPALAVCVAFRPRGRAIHAPLRAALHGRRRSVRAPLVCAELVQDGESALSVGSRRARLASERGAVAAEQLVRRALRSGRLHDREMGCAIAQRVGGRHQWRSYLVSWARSPRKRRGLPLLAAAAAGAGLWIWSIPYTVGGVEYSMRVLTPTVVALSVACGAWGPLVAPMCGLSSSLVRRALFGVVTTVLLIGGAYTVLYCATFPAAIQNLPAAIRDFRNTMFSRREYPVAQLGGDLDVVKILNESGLPPERVLTDNCYLATALRRSSRFQPVMIWSPEAAFIFDKSLTQRRSGSVARRSHMVCFALPPATSLCGHVTHSLPSTVSTGDRQWHRANFKRFIICHSSRNDNLAAGSLARSALRGRGRSARRRPSEYRCLPPAAGAKRVTFFSSIVIVPGSERVK